MKKRILTIAFTLLSIGMTYAQDDTALWGVISIKKPLPHNWVGMLRSEIHSRNNTSDMDYWYILGGGGKKINNWLRTDFGLIYVNYKSASTSTLPSFWRPMYRTYLSFTFSHKIGAIRALLREYWGYCWKPETTIESTYKPGSAYHELRSRLRLECQIPESKFTPYIYTAIWNKDKLERVRYCVGMDYKMDKHNTFGFFYMWQNKHHSTDTHVLGVEYGLTL